MSVYSDLVRRLGHSPLFAKFGARVIFPLDRWLYPRVGGRVLSAAGRVLPILSLTTTGRRSGKARRVPLVYLEDGDDLVVIASNWGRDRHPAWSENLLSNPEASVQVRAHERRVRARLATPDERERLWARIVELWPAYNTYAERAGDREIRVFLLEPAP